MESVEEIRQDLRGTPLYLLYAILSTLRQTTEQIQTETASNNAGEVYDFEREFCINKIIQTLTNSGVPLEHFVKSLKSLCDKNKAG